MASRPKLEDKVVKWKLDHSPKNEKGEFKDQKTGKDIPNKPEKKVKTNENVKESPKKIDWKKFYTDKNGKVDKEKRAKVKQIRKDHARGHKAYKRNCKSVSEYKEKRTRFLASKAAGMATGAGTAALIKCPHGAAVAGRAVEAATYNGVERMQKHKRENVANRYKENPQDKKKINQYIKADKTLTQRSYGNRDMTEAQLRYRLEHFDDEPSEAKRESWVKKNAPAPKQEKGKEKKPDYSNLIRNKDGTISKEKKKLLKRAEKRHEKQHKAFKKGFSSVDAMNKENKRQLASKISGEAANQISSLGFKNANLNHGNNGVTRFAGDKAEGFAAGQVGAGVEKATYQAVGGAQKKSDERLAKSDNNIKIADRVMDGKRRDKRTDGQKYLDEKQMERAMEKERKLQEYKDAQKQEKKLQREQRRNEKKLQREEKRNAKKENQPAKAPESKKTETKKTDEYGISVPEKKEKSTPSNNQGKKR